MFETESKEDLEAYIKIIADECNVKEVEFIKMTKTFEELWEKICERSDSRYPVVQNYHELEFVFNLIQSCESYLEVGTAEGNSLYVLAHALKLNAAITYVDLDETHTRPYREMVVKDFPQIKAIHGNSHDPETIRQADGKYEVVLIDAGHSFDDAYLDAKHYGKMATKYIIFHDVCLPEVERAFALYQKETGLKAYKIINSETFGYGILEK